jgi:hypothetical protein
MKIKNILNYDNNKLEKSRKKIFALTVSKNFIDRNIKQ